jgi:hypothetical protein
MFSVALNIGFVLVAISLACHHSISFEKRSRKVVKGMVQRLNLPATQESAILDSIQDFRKTLIAQDRDLRKARGDILRLLAASGPLDPVRLHAMVDATDIQEKLKNRMLENHVLELRNRLGDEKGAMFFAYLLEHLESEYRPHPR